MAGLVAVALVAALALVAGRLGGEPDPPAAVAVPTATPTAEPAPSPTEEPTQEASEPVDGSVPLTVEVAAVGLSAEVLPITPSGGELDPPTYGEAYWIEPYGAPGQEPGNTVYLAGHSATRGGAIFDPLFDRSSQTSRVAAGDEVVVTTGEGSWTYVVERTERYRKDRLATTDEVWSIVPGRLVLITCFQRAEGGASQDNLVVYAQLTDGPTSAG